MCWFMCLCIWTHAEVLSRNRVEASLARIKGQTQISVWQQGWDQKPLSAAGLMKDGTPWEDGIFLWSTSFSLFLHVCILKGWGVSILGTEKDTTKIIGTIFLFTSNIPNEYNIRGQRGDVTFAWSLFVYQKNKSCGCCAGCRKQTLPFNTSCCYFGKNMSPVWFADAEFNTTWMQQEVSDPLWQYKEVK